MIGLGLLIQAVAMLLQGWFCSQRAQRIPFYALFSGLASAFLIWGYSAVLFAGATESYLLSIPGLSEAAEIVIDPLAAFFGLLFAFGFPLGLLYGHYYLKAHPGRGLASHNLFLGIMILSMHLVLMLRSSLLFMVAWELMSLSSFLAILQDRDNQESVAAALYYFVMMQAGAAVLLLGFGVQYMQTGSLNLANLAISGWAKWLLLIGFAFKAGFFPFYSWLPKAHPVAPAHLSGMMSGLMIKTGIFGIIIVLSHAKWQPYEIYILLGISLITAFNGVIHALAESNIKRSLAYSSIENIGIIGIGLCFWLLGQALANPVMAALGLAGALLHTLNHSLFKPLMFYLSGNVLVQSHSLETDQLGGLSKRLPYTAMLFLMGTAAISALPLFNGFISEFGIFLSILNGFDPHNLGSTLCSVTAGGMFAFVSALALIAFSKIFSISFGGEPRSASAKQASESPLGMLLSPAILAGVSLLFGIFGRLALLIVSPVASALGADSAVLIQFGHTLDGVSIVLLILLACYVTVYLLKKHLNSIKFINTWSCGYAKASSRLQYTGSAYISPLAYFLKPLMHKSTSSSKVDGYFPTQMEYSEQVRDYVDRGLIQMLCKAIQRFLSLFSSIHNGRTNSYITYLLLALLALLFWVLGVPK